MFLSCPISKKYKQYLVNFPNDLLIIDKINPTFIGLIVIYNSTLSKKNEMNSRVGFMPSRREASKDIFVFDGIVN